MKTGNYLAINHALNRHKLEYREYRDQIKHVLDVCKHLKIDFNNESLEGAFFMCRNFDTETMTHFANSNEVFEIKTSSIATSRALDTLSLKAEEVGDHYKCTAYKCGKLVYESGLIEPTVFESIDHKQLISRLALINKIGEIEVSTMEDIPSRRSLQEIMKDPRPGEAMEVAKKLFKFSKKKGELLKWGRKEMEIVSNYAVKLVSQGMSAFLMYTYFAARHRKEFINGDFNSAAIARSLIKAEQDEGREPVDVSNSDHFDEEARHEFMAAFNQFNMNKFIGSPEVKVRSRVSL